MRTLALPLTVLALAVGLAVAAVSARAEGEGDPAARILLLESQVKSLKADVDYLAARESTLTKYLVGLSQASENLRNGTAQARTLGFEAAAIPQQSRTAVLLMIDRLAADVSAGLPAPTKVEMDLRRQAEALRKSVYGQR